MKKAPMKYAIETFSSMIHVVQLWVQYMEQSLQTTVSTVFQPSE